MSRDGENELVFGFRLIRSAMAIVDVTGPEKAVLMVLAAMANDKAQAWPPMNGEAGLATKCCLGERTVQRAIKALEQAKHITRDEKMGKGVVYTVHPRHSGTPATETPRQADTPVREAATPATAAPNQPRTTIPKKDKPSLDTPARKRDLYPAPPGVPENVWQDFRDSPKRRKAGMSPTAYSGIKNNLVILAEHGFPPGKMIELAVERGWVTVKLEWVQNDGRTSRNGSLGQRMGGHQPSDGLSPTTRAALAVFGPGDERRVPQ